jgi:predicted RNase H-like HicB family nuclease
MPWQSRRALLSRADEGERDREGVAMNHYIGIFVQNDVGEWRVVFPDMPGCEAKGFTLDDAKFAAVTALVKCIRESGAPAPLPMDMAAILRSKDWLKQNRVNLSKAVVTMVPLAA